MCGEQNFPILMAKVVDNRKVPKHKKEIHFLEDRGAC